MRNPSRSAPASFVLAALAAFGALTAACGASLPPAELVLARESYANTAKGPASQYRPDVLQDAKEALDAAEHKFDKEGPSEPTKFLAQVAALKAQQAEAEAQTAIAQKQKDEADKKLEATIDSVRHERQQTKQELAGERQKREELEKKYAQAVADLKNIAAVKQETRGTVITLSGEVLFASGQAALLAGAMVKLNDVADALTKSNPESKMVVEGHTDSQGKAGFNQDLSLRRAQAVRDYLVSRGIASDRISAQGLGSSRPIASNGNPEGRANNRRVEIIVQPAAQ